MPPSPSLDSTRYGPIRRPTRVGGGGQGATATAGRPRNSAALASAASSDSTSRRSSRRSPQERDRKAARSAAGSAAASSNNASTRSQELAANRALPAAQAPIQPRLGDAEAPPHRDLRHAQHRRDLVVLQPSEEAQLDDLRELLVHGLQLDQGRVHGHDVGVGPG